MSEVQTQPHQRMHRRHISIKSAARKLPVKRKTPESQSQALAPGPPSSISLSDHEQHGDLRPPPFKFHRIWSEPDEIRFLQGLIDCSSRGLTFPRDLNAFFDSFSQSMPRPYTKSQLAEKVRRLKRKFRVVSARLSRGLDASRLAPHDRSLLHLSMQLWRPATAASSPFSASTSLNENSPRILPNVPLPDCSATSLPESVTVSPPPLFRCDGDHLNEEEDSQARNGSGRFSGLGRATAQMVIDIFDQSLEGFRKVLVGHDLLYPSDAVGCSAPEREKEGYLTVKWREQRAAELHALSRRLRLVLEHAVRE